MWARCRAQRESCWTCVRVPSHRSLFLPAASREPQAVARGQAVAPIDTAAEADRDWRGPATQGRTARSRPSGRACNARCSTGSSSPTWPRPRRRSPPTPATTPIPPPRRARLADARRALRRDAVHRPRLRERGAPGWCRRPPRRNPCRLTPVSTSPGNFTNSPIPRPGADGRSLGGRRPRRQDPHVWCRPDSWLER